MYPDLELARNRIAELHHLAERADLAIAIAGPAARAGTGPGLPCPPGWPAPRAGCSPQTAPGPAAGPPPAPDDAPGLYRTPARRPGQAHATAPAARRPQHPEHPNLRPSGEERQNTSTHAERRLSGALTVYAAPD